MRIPSELVWYQALFGVPNFGLGAYGCSIRSPPRHRHVAHLISSQGLARTPTPIDTDSRHSDGCLYRHGWNAYFLHTGSHHVICWHSRPARQEAPFFFERFGNSRFLYGLHRSSCSGIKLICPFPARDDGNRRLQPAFRISRRTHLGQHVQGPCARAIPHRICGLSRAMVCKRDFQDLAPHITDSKRYLRSVSAHLLLMRTHSFYLQCIWLSVCAFSSASFISNRRCVHRNRAVLRRRALCSYSGIDRPCRSAHHCFIMRCIHLDYMGTAL